ncbi:MAG: hypothetical protein ACKOPS_02265 [Cyanobium sp.]
MPGSDPQQAPPAPEITKPAGAACTRASASSNPAFLRLLAERA